jgi:hypothetical protein
MREDERGARLRTFCQAAREVSNLEIPAPPAPLDGKIPRRLSIHMSVWIFPSLFLEEFFSFE